MQQLLIIFSCFIATQDINFKMDENEFWLTSILAKAKRQKGSSSIEVGKLQSLRYTKECSRQATVRP